MSGFERKHSNVQGLLTWEGEPDDNAAHRKILEWLQCSATSGFLSSSDSLSNPLKGNIGEFIAYKLGDEFIFTNTEIADAANAWNPLSKISRPDIDIVWLYFGETESDDWAALQEVKTTGEASLELARNLTTDYDKLFGEDPCLTLQTRLAATKNKLDQLGLGELSPRVTALGGPSPNLSQGIRLLPTLIHDSAHPSDMRMTSVRQTLIGQGWSSYVVECWSIALSDLDDRLSRLARGQL